MFTRKRRGARQQRRLALPPPLALRRPGVRLVEHTLFQTASERRGNKITRSNDFHLNAKARIWPDPWCRTFHVRRRGEILKGLQEF